MGAAWLITHAVIQIWIAPIRSHPEGAAVLFSHGSRGFLDFLRLYPDYARRALRWAGILIAVYGAMSLAAAAVLPSALAKPHGQSVVASWRNGLRVSPRVAVIGTISAVAAILAIAGGLLAMWLISGTVANMPNARTADLLCVAGALPSVAVLLGIRLWSDVAVAHVAAAGQGVYAASASALRALRNEGRSLAGAYPHGARTQQCAARGRAGRSPAFRRRAVWVSRCSGAGNPAAVCGASYRGARRVVCVPHGARNLTLSSRWRSTLS